MFVPLEWTHCWDLYAPGKPAEGVAAADPVGTGIGPTDTGRLSNGNLVEGDASLCLIKEFEPQYEVVELELVQVNPLFLWSSVHNPFVYSFRKWCDMGVTWPHDSVSPPSSQDCQRSGGSRLSKSGG
jgi:hypothetical protein